MLFMGRACNCALTDGNVQELIHHTGGMANSEFLGDADPADEGLFLPVDAPLSAAGPDVRWQSVNCLCKGFLGGRSHRNLLA